MLKFGMLMTLSMFGHFQSILSITACGTVVVAIPKLMLELV